MDNDCISFDRREGRWEGADGENEPDRDRERDLEFTDILDRERERS